jgi:hypothetical protein
MQDQHLLDDLTVLYISFINRSLFTRLLSRLRQIKNYFDRPIKKLAAIRAPHVYQETKLMENIHKIILALSIFYVGPMLSPPVHKILRNRKTNAGFMYFSILLPIISFARGISICLKMTNRARLWHFTQLYI